MDENRMTRRTRFLKYSPLSYPIIFIILFTFSILLSSSTNITSYHRIEALAQTTTKDFVGYENATLGIKIQYPSDWHILSSNNSLIRFVSPPENDADNFFEQLRIATSPIAHCGNISLDELTNKIAADHKKSGVDVKMNESKAVVLRNGNTANKLVYTFMDSQFGMLKGQDILTLKDGKLYLIQYYANSLQYSTFLPIIQNMIDSFQILNASGSIKEVLNMDENQENKPPLTYTNHKYGLTMQYPYDWRKEEIDTTPRDYDIDIVQFYSPASCATGKYNVEFSIMIRMYRDENTPKNVNEELEYVIDKANIMSTNFKVVESSTNTTLAGYPAYKIVWTEIIDDTPIEVMEMGIIIRGDVYVVDYRAEPDRYSILLPIVEQMINSLKINS